MNVGLRVDIDTFRGTRHGVPNLCKLLDKHGIKASFFFSVGPDNMGRHLWRLLRPAFLWKMLRTKAASLYGWDILFKGTVGSGPIIGKKLGDIIRMVKDAGHEVGLHAWDHYKWQTYIDSMSKEAIYSSLQEGVNLLTEILGRPPTCSAVPSWKCSDQTLIEKSKFPFVYNSDCRGVNVFNPVVNGSELSQPQIPVTLPTYDEVIGCKGISTKNYNEYILSLLHPERLNVLTIHAEVEGIAFRDLFDAFLVKAVDHGAQFIPLGNLLQGGLKFTAAPMMRKTVPGREGWISVQLES